MLSSLRDRLSTLLGRDPLVPVALAAGLGIVLADSLETRIPLIAYAATALIAFAIAWKKPTWHGLLALGTLGVFALGHGVALWQIGQFPFAPNLNHGDSLRIEVTGLVVKEPDAPGAGRSRSGRCVLRVTEMRVAGVTWHCDQRLPTRLVSPNESLRYGDRIATTGLLGPFDPPRSPGAFDSAAFFRRTLGATGEFSVGSGDRIRIIERDLGNPLIALALKSRHAIEGFITRGLEDQPDTASVIKAMVLGSREDTPEHIEEQFRLSGAMHVFAVSGLHVGIFLAFLWGLLRWLGMPRRHAVLLLIPAILFYAAVTGLRPSAVRAAVMGTVVLLGFVAERRPRLINSLAFAALLILAIDTQQLFLPGFQLSFAVLASIALFADGLRALFYHPWRIDPFLPRRYVPRWRRGIDRGANWLTSGLAVSITAWAGSAFLVIYHFQILTPVAIVSNVVMVPFAALVLGVAGVSLLVSLIGGGILAGSLINPLNGGLVRFVSWMAGIFASAPGGYVHVSPETLSGSGSSADSCRVTVFEPTIGGLSQLWSFHLPDQRTAHWLIDPGDPIGFASAGQPLLRHHAINRVQALMLTHGDFDHLGAAPLLIDRLRPGAVMATPFESRSSVIPRIQESIDRTRVSHLQLARGDRVPMSENSVVTVLYPPREETPPSLADDRCLVLQLRHHDWRVLSTADSGFLTEKWLLANETRGLRADVWIKGWHATDFSGLTEFLDQVQPKVVITTHHEFPPQESITEAWRHALKSRSIQLYNITELGAVEVELTAETLSVTPTSSHRQAPTQLTR